MVCSVRHHKLCRCAAQLDVATASKAVLETNISKLYNTAKTEIKRKDEEIIRLRRMYGLSPVRL